MPIGAFKLNSIAKYLAPTALRPKTITVNGNAQVSTAQSKFGGASALFDGSGDYLNTAVYSDLNSASSDVTWECWIYVNNVTGAKIVMGGRYDYEPLIYLSGSTLRLYLSSNGTSWNLVNGATFGTLAINTWYHIAFVRNGTTVKTYRDGVEQSSTAVSTTAIWWTSTPQLYIGCIDPTLSNAFWNGYIDEVRISSTARYTANFTAPTSAFISDANTVFLMHADGANASTTFTDDTEEGNPFSFSTLTYDSNVGSVSAQSTAPYGLFFKDDGTKMYIQGSGTIYQYSLSTAWSPSTRTYDNVSFNTQTATGTGFNYAIYFGNSGTRLYVNKLNTIYQYNLSTAWLMSSASYIGSFSFSSQAGQTKGIGFSADGTKLYALSNITETVYQYTLSTAWNITTASYANKSAAVSVGAGYDRFSIWFNGTGTRMWTGSTEDRLKRQTLTTPWDISTAGAVTNITYASQSNQTGFYIRNDGLKVFIISDNNADVKRYSTSGT